MSGGRVELGLGAGWNDREHAAYGIPFPDTGERFERLEEQLAIITGLWATPIGERFSYDGHALLARRLPRAAEAGAATAPADRHRRVRADAHAAPRGAVRQRVQRRVRAARRVPRDRRRACAPRARRSGATRRSLPHEHRQHRGVRRRRRRGRRGAPRPSAATPRPARLAHFAGTPAEVIDRIGAYRDARRRDRLLPGARPPRPRPPAAPRRRGRARVQLTLDHLVERVEASGPTARRRRARSTPPARTCASRPRRPTPSAHAERRLDRRHVAHHDHVAVARLVEQLLARGPHPHAERGERLAARRARSADRPATRATRRRARRATG